MVTTWLIKEQDLFSLSLSLFKGVALHKSINICNVYSEIIVHNFIVTVKLHRIVPCDGVSGSGTTHPPRPVRLRLAFSHSVDKRQDLPRLCPSLQPLHQAREKKTPHPRKPKDRGAKPVSLVSLCACTDPAIQVPSSAFLCVIYLVAEGFISEQGAFGGPFSLGT